MEWYWIVLIALGAFFLGYQFCMLRNCVKESHAFMKLVADYFGGVVDHEQFIKKLDEIFWWHKEK